jgi:hypothetical protein
MVTTNCTANLWYADSDGVANITDNPSDCFNKNPTPNATLPCVVAQWQCTFPESSSSGTITTIQSDQIHMFYTTSVIIIMLLAIVVGLQTFK